MARGLGEKRPEVDDGLTRRSHLSVGSTCQWKRERRGVPIRLDPGWAVGRFGVGPERVPEVQFSYFSYSFSFSFFCFLISILSFANMPQINSNHFQEVSKIQSIKVGQ
jgi:hypothetical protein